jgi:hypothetical protein
MRLHSSPFSTTLPSLKSHLDGSVCESENGAVAQSVERSPEKAGVGGSIPPCPTCKINDLWALPGWPTSPWCPYGVYGG